VDKRRKRLELFPLNEKLKKNASVTEKVTEAFFKRIFF